MFLFALYAGTMKRDVPFHPLRVWLFERRETAAEFAGRCGMSRSYLSEILTYKRRPAPSTIDKIRDATDGAISANDLVPPLPTRPTTATERTPPDGESNGRRTGAGV